MNANEFPAGHPWAIPAHAANTMARALPDARSALPLLGPVDNLSPAGTTMWLPPLGTGVDHRRQSLPEVVLYSAGSVAGQSAVSDWLSCPEYSRLRKMPVRMKPPVRYEVDDLDPASFGTMMHALRAMRWLYGAQVVYELLERWRPEMTEDDYLKAKMLWHVYDTMYVLGSDPFEFLGVEVEVRTALRGWNGEPIIRSCRYDTIIRYLSTGEVASFEFKTMSRSGRGGLLPYYKQGASQMAIWNSNQELVGRYGPMGEVLYDCAVKTKVPSVERYPERFTRFQQVLAHKYLTSPEQGVKFTIGPDGRFPQNLHTCYGRWRPCEYVDLCWNEAYGMYTVGETGETYDGR